MQKGIYRNFIQYIQEANPTCMVISIFIVDILYNKSTLVKGLAIVIFSLVF
jgi:hypothetical protein